MSTCSSARTTTSGCSAAPHDWQVGYSLPKGGYRPCARPGVEPIRRFLAERVPWLADRSHLLTDMNQTTLLSVDISRVQRVAPARRCC